MRSFAGRQSILTEIKVEDPKPYHPLPTDIWNIVIAMDIVNTDKPFLIRVKEWKAQGYITPICLERFVIPFLEKSPLANQVFIDETKLSQNEKYIKIILDENLSYISYQVKSEQLALLESLLTSSNTPQEENHYEMKEEQNELEKPLLKNYSEDVYLKKNENLKTIFDNLQRIRSDSIINSQCRPFFVDLLLLYNLIQYTLKMPNKTFHDLKEDKTNALMSILKKEQNKIVNKVDWYENMMNRSYDCIHNPRMLTQFIFALFGVAGVVLVGDGTERNNNIEKWAGAGCFAIGGLGVMCCLMGAVITNQVSNWRASINRNRLGFFNRLTSSTIKPTELSPEFKPTI